MAEFLESAEAIARRAWDELCIMRTLARVARAQDDLDETAYCRCFTENVLLTTAVMFPNWQSKEIPARELARMTIETLSKRDAVHHVVTGPIIDVDGDVARCEADLFAVSLRSEAGKKIATTMGGRYTLRLVRQNGEWLICERGITARYQFDTEAFVKGPLK
jgi:SnoaL-like domain